MMIAVARAWHRMKRIVIAVLVVAALVLVVYLLRR
jgi:hypothetical protein